MSIQFRPGITPSGIQGSMASKAAAGKTGFAGFLAGVAPVANAAASVGKAVLQTALGPAGGLVGGLAQNLVGAATGNADYLDMVDKIRTFAMTNAICAAGNAPVVERDNS